MRGMTPRMRAPLLALVRSLPLIALAMVTGCDDKKDLVDAGAVDAGPPVLAEKEPNDGPDKALTLERTSIVEANLGADPAKPDEDWYLLKSGIPKSVELDVSCPPGADVGLDVMDESRSVLSSINAGGVGQGEKLPNLDVSGRVFVRVVSLKKGTGGAYTLSAKFHDRVPGFELEPNDRRVDATPVPLGQAVSGFVAHGNDQDWFRYELPTAVTEPDAGAAEALDAGPTDGGASTDAGAAPAVDADTARDAGPVPEPRLALRVDISGVEGVALDVQVLTEAEAVLFSARSREGQGLSLRNVGARASDKVLYVVVRSLPTGTGKEQKKGANTQTYYTLTVAPEEKAERAELEPNDDASHATELRSSGYREGFISPRGDLDYYRLVTDGPSIAKIQVSGVEKVDLMLSIVRPVEGKPEETVLRANEGGVKEPELLNDVSCDGSCLIRVEAAPRKIDGKWVREDENGDQSYRLSVAVVPDDGSEEKEPNNTAPMATPVLFGKPIRGTVYPKRDVDYFQLDLRTKPVKTALVATLIGVLKVDVALYLHRVEADGKLTLVQTSDAAKGDKAEVVRFAAEPGLYVFEVRDLKNREANFQDRYQLTVEETE